MGYRPNVEALEWVASGRPERHALRLLVAGHGPTDQVVELCAEHGWVLEENYPDNQWLAERAEVAIARALKERFDPHGILNPGRFAGCL